MPSVLSWNLASTSVAANSVTAGVKVASRNIDRLRELTALQESAEQPVSPFAGPLPAAVTRHARVGPARLRCRGGLPGAHPVRAAPPPGVARA